MTQVALTQISELDFQIDQIKSDLLVFFPLQSFHLLHPFFDPLQAHVVISNSQSDLKILYYNKTQILKKNAYQMCTKYAL